MKLQSLIRATASTAFVVAATCIGAHTASAQSAEQFPSRPLTLTVPFGAGSTTDLFARVVAEGLRKQLDEAVVVENRPGAGGTLGIGQALRAGDDGHTLMLVTTSSIAVNGSLYSSLEYDPAKDITVVGIISTTPNALIVAAGQKMDTFEDFSKRMKDGGKHFYNSQGNGTSQHLSSVLLSNLMEIEVEHVPYRGMEGITGMISGQTEFAFASLPSVLPLANGGKLNVLAVTGPKPAVAMPKAPTLASLGYESFAMSNIWYGVGVKSSTPDAIKAKLSDALAKVAADTDVREKLGTAGFEPMTPMTSGERETYVEEQVKFWSELVKESGAKVD